MSRIVAVSFIHSAQAVKNILPVGSKRAWNGLTIVLINSCNFHNKWLTTIIKRYKSIVSIDIMYCCESRAASESGS